MHARRATLIAALLLTFATTGLAAAPDPARPQQWYLDDIRWDLACAVECGDGSVRVAVIDTGFDLDHSDLAGRFVAGYDFLDNDNDPNDPLPAPAPTHQDLGHGTQTSGVLGAITNNGVGISGVADVSIIPIRAISVSTGISASLLAQTIDYAVAQNADIISFSGHVTSGTTPQWNALNASIAAADSAGVLIVAAAGNTVDATNVCAYATARWPAAHPRVLAVGGTNPDGKTSALSYWGPEVDIAAPMEGIYTTQRGDSYTVTTGTSFSTPMVAGTAALLLTQDPTRTADDVRAILTSSATPIPRDPAHVCLGQSTSALMPFGKLDAGRAVTGIL